MFASCSTSLGGRTPTNATDAGAAKDVAAPEDAKMLQMVLVGPGGSHAFLPSSIVVPVGATVEWFWESDGHTVTSGAGGVADNEFCSPKDSSCATSPLSSAGTVYRHSFEKQGTFPYFCIPHFSVGMKGTVTVR